ncbi:MAG: tetratricopeptide repeat protein [Gemmataceae bacterium]|nr:tetratricopeptide repeat protein [Gemmataceae bacterium]MDW8264098.1 tetratricopeptide repeat protein [Gemmataceae bacterium]
MTVAEALERARGHIRQGQWAEAESWVREVIRVAPGEAAAFQLLATIAHGVGRPEAAELALREAIARAPSQAENYAFLASLLAAQGRLAEAEAAARRAVMLQPGWAVAYAQLGDILLAQRRLAEAEAAYRHALAWAPAMAEAWCQLGAVLRAQGRLGEAEMALRQALALNPQSASAEKLLGHVLKSQGRLLEAEAAYLRSITWNPTDATTFGNLGDVYHLQSRFQDAERAYRQALALSPTYGGAVNNLAYVLEAQGRLDEAEAAAWRALELLPNLPEAHLNLGNLMQTRGRLEEAIRHFRRARELRPSYVSASSNILRCEQYRPGITPARLAQLHRDWEARHVAELRQLPRDLPNGRDPDRVLLLGLISNDFCRHPVGYFVAPLFEHHDRERLQIVCYGDRVRADDWTDRLRAAADEWHDIRLLDDEQLAERIRADRIDLLVDLAGHTAYHRLLTFARKPAPLQFTWIGYTGTTGLSAIDYLIADRFHVPEGDEAHYCEKVLRLPDGYVCYPPPEDAPTVGPLPAQEAGCVTFGSFNYPAKITPPVIALWADILRRLPGSRLLLKFNGLGDPGLRRRLLDQFAAAGIDPGRLELQGWSPRRQLLETYHKVDIALDPFPYSGGLTTCEALWMGVPVITCPGETFAGRHSFSHLSNAGLTETIARDRDEYVRLAVELARDWPRLAALRAGLRERMRRSPLCDGPRFARHVEAALRSVWRRWCQDHPA